MSSTIWVCVDCLVADVNGEDPQDRPESEPAVWALESQYEELTLGLLDSEHSTYCARDDNYGECDCAEQSFSWSSCEGCGSTLGGSRHAYTEWSA